jgi:hypothetical protein
MRQSRWTGIVGIACLVGCSGAGFVAESAALVVDGGEASAGDAGGIGSAAHDSAPPATIDADAGADGAIPPFDAGELDAATGCPGLAPALDASTSFSCVAVPTGLCPACAPFEFSCVNGSVPISFRQADAGVAVVRLTGPNGPVACAASPACVVATQQHGAICGASLPVAWSCSTTLDGGTQDGLPAGCTLTAGASPTEGAVYCCP